MRRNLYSLIIICFSFLTGYAQRDTIAATYGATINMQDLYKHLSVLASDEYEGRETGTPGLDLAADYIATQFKFNGLIPPSNGTYYQKFNLTSTTANNSVLKLDKTDFQYGNQFFFSGIFNSDTLSIDQTLFLGYGIDDPAYSDYKDVDVKDKYVVVLMGEPVKDSVSFITKSKKTSAWTFDRFKKIELAKTKGAKGIIIIPEDYNTFFERIRRFIVEPIPVLEKKENNDIPFIVINNDIGNRLLTSNNKSYTAEYLRKKIADEGKPFSFVINQNITINAILDKKESTSQNVVGFIEGSDLKKEVIVISAHYDHLGIKDGKVFNGADDDGSGTVAVMEIAEAFAKYKRKGFSPKRSILFILFAGEEKGLLGSEYYSSNPLFPLANTVCDLNIDMIGRVDKDHFMKQDYVYVIGSEMLSTELKKINERNNKLYTNLSLDYKYDDLADENRFYYRSDHYNFAKKNIPIIFYFNGVHDDYHKETDEIAKIDFELIEKRTKLVYYTAWSLANMKVRITADKVK